MNEEIISECRDKWLEENFWRVKEARWRRRGIIDFTYKLYLSLLKKQKGKCKICKHEDKLVVDHDHKTGKVRGLLCASCNIALGRFNDNLNIMKNAVKYLDEKGK